MDMYNLSNLMYGLRYSIVKKAVQSLLAAKYYLWPERADSPSNDLGEIMEAIFYKGGKCFVKVMRYDNKKEKLVHVTSFDVDQDASFTEVIDQQQIFGTEISDVFNPVWDFMEDIYGGSFEVVTG